MPMIVKTYYRIILTKEEMNYLLEIMEEYDTTIDYSYSYRNEHYKIDAYKEEFIDLYHALRSAYRDYSDEENQKTKIVRKLYYEIRLIVEGW